MTEEHQGGVPRLTPPPPTEKDRPEMHLRDRIDQDFLKDLGL